MNDTLHPEAEAEFDEAIAHYEPRRPGLGLEFAFEIHATIRLILDAPKIWPQLDGEVRRCLTNRFPYGVLYSIEPERIFILAIMHLHRDPDYWQDR